MSGPSSSGDAWLTRLLPVQPADLPRRSDDPRLAEVTYFWQTGVPSLRPGQPVLIGFPQDEGVRRNHGRPGAAAAPDAIRPWLYRLVSQCAREDVDLGTLGLLDLGNLRIEAPLEDSQESLAEVLRVVLAQRAIPLVLGGGHETAYGHFLGYLRAGLPVGIINVDAHLDVRPTLDGKGHSGSPFRQALEHPSQPLPGDRYVCLGLQPSAVSRHHLDFVGSRGGVACWAEDVRGRLAETFRHECERLHGLGCLVYVSLDSDVACAADVPAVSAPNPLGLSGMELAAWALRAGAAPEVASFDLVEINPSHDRDQQSGRWAATILWNFLVGLAKRLLSKT